MSRRVVITGCGVISPLGKTKDAFWDALRAGQSGVDRLELLPSDNLPVKCGGEASDFTGHIDDFGSLAPACKKAIRKGLKVMCREIKMGVAATQWSLADAQLDLTTYDPDRIGVVYGSDYIMTMPEEFTAAIKDCLGEDRHFDFASWPTEGMSKVTPLWLLKYLPNMPACHVAIYNDLRGPNNSITMREASSNLAIAEAFTTIVRGGADVLVTGATGTRIHPLRTIHTQLQEELATGDEEPTRLSRPFDLNRKGMVVGEGAATLVLEELESARTRNAKILGEVVGYGSSTVIDRQAVGHRDAALKNAMVQAIDTAGISIEDVGHINAHGLGTQQSDVAEANAIRSVFNGRGDRIPVTAAKSYFGNLGAAGGMIELIASVMAMQEDKLFPTLNYTSPDPKCDLNIVVGDHQPTGDNVLNLNVTPQGQASAVIISRSTN